MKQTYGLPLENRMLTPVLFSRAARRCGLSDSLFSKQLDNLSGLLLPCVLLLEDNQACVLLELKVSEGKALIVQPEAADSAYERTPPGQMGCQRSIPSRPQKPLFVTGEEFCSVAAEIKPI